MTLKIAVFAPMPSPSVSTATAVKPGFFSNWRKANLRSFIAQCLHRIDLCGSPRWQPAGERGNGNHNGGVDGEDERIGGAHAKQHVFEHARYGPRCNQA